MSASPIFIITGPPGAGKTTLSRELLGRFDFGFHLAVDDLRTWVIQGLSESVNWTEETERQFQIAEQAACGIANCYAGNGFAVAFDHCRNIRRLDEMCAAFLAGNAVHKVLLLPELDVALERNRTRTNKDFDTTLLVDIIHHTHKVFRESITEEWIVLDSAQPVSVLADNLMHLIDGAGPRR